jgi:basic amino acid/polyamine antiporter, APA family
MERRLGLLAATSVVVGQVIAVGIFLTPATMARTLGSPLLVLLVWLLIGATAIAGALVYGELAARYPEAGGGYVYLREAWGRRVAFLYGWKCLLVMDPGIAAALAVGLAAYVGYLVPLGPLALKAVAIGAILVAAGINILGTREGARVMGLLTALKLGALAAIVVGGFAFGRGDWGHFVPFATVRPGSPALPEALAGGTLAAFFSFGGWWEATKLAGEVRDPARNVPRALVTGLAIVTAAYVATSAVFLYLVPLDQVTTGEAFAAQAGEALLGSIGGRVFAVVVVVSVAGSLLATLMGPPRVYYAMGRDGVFPSAVGQLSARFGTPARAVAIQATLASLLVAAGSFNQIVAYFVFITVAFVGLTVAGAFRLRRRGGPAPAYLAPGYPVTPLVFLALLAVLLAVVAAGSPRQALGGTMVVALGLPVAAVLERSRRASRATDGSPA